MSRINSPARILRPSSAWQPESEIRSAPLHAKIRPRFKKMAEKMASEDDRSLAQWLEKTIQAAHERRATMSWKAQTEQGRITV
jgi:hypothetical protein